MPTYRTPTLSLDESPIPERTLAYFRRRLRHELHELVVREFHRRAEQVGYTKRRLAERLDKRPEQITRWLGAPGNWRLDTVSDLLVGMGIDPRRVVAALPAEPR